MLRTLQRLLCLALIALSCGQFTTTVSANDDPSEIFAAYAVSMNAETGEVLFEKDAQMQAFPASITKVMTALLLVENLNEENEITITKEATLLDKSNWQIEFVEGETLSRNEALRALMVLSSNDVASSIGTAIAGSEQAFAQLMNKRAAELGLVNTHFTNASGLHDPEHVTTAYDIAKITRVLLQHEDVIQMMGLKNTEITTNKQHKNIFSRAQYFKNENTIAGKTGYTNEAGNTLVTVDQMDNKTIINVIMKSNRAEMYTDIKKVAAEAFPKLHSVELLNAERSKMDIPLLNEHVPVALKTNLMLSTALSNPTVTLQTHDSEPEALGENSLTEDDFVIKVQSLPQQTDKLLEQGIKKDEHLADVEVFYKNEKILTAPVFATETKTFEKVQVGAKIVKVSTVKVSVFFGIFSILFLISLIMFRKRRSIGA